MRRDLGHMTGGHREDPTTATQPLDTDHCPVLWD